MSTTGGGGEVRRQRRLGDAKRHGRKSAAVGMTYAGSARFKQFHCRRLLEEHSVVIGIFTITIQCSGIGALCQ